MAETIFTRPSGARLFDPFFALQEENSEHYEFIYIFFLDKTKHQDNSSSSNYKAKALQKEKNIMSKFIRVVVGSAQEAQPNPTFYFSSSPSHPLHNFLLHSAEHRLS